MSFHCVYIRYLIKHFFIWYIIGNKEKKLHIYAYETENSKCIGDILTDKKGKSLILPSLAK